MSIYNLGSCHGAGALFENKLLDEKLYAVLDWLDGNECGLGEIIDRLQHLSACRNIRNRFGEEPPSCLETPRGANPNQSRRLPLTRREVLELKAKGYSLKEIADIMECSVGTVHNRSRSDYKNNLDWILRSGEKQD